MKVQPTTKQLIEMLYERLPELFDRAAAQPAPVPLMDEQIVDTFCKAPHQTQYVAWFAAGVRYAEAHHGIKQALAAPVQEPVAQYSDIVSDGGPDPRNKFDTPPVAQRQWVGLTTGERDALFTKHYQWDAYGKAIEAKLRSKNI
jgi:hypothetical protein